MKTLQAALPAVDLVVDVRARRGTPASRIRRTHRHANGGEPSSWSLAHRSSPAGAAEVWQRGSHQGRLPRPARTPVSRNAFARYAPCDTRPAKDSGLHGYRHPDAGAGYRREYRCLCRDRQHPDPAAAVSAGGGAGRCLAHGAGVARCRRRPRLLRLPCISPTARRTRPSNISECGAPATPASPGLPSRNCFECSS